MGAGKIRRKVDWRGKPLAYLIDWYYAIRSGAQSGFGHQPIAWSEMQAFAELFQVDLDAFDAESLRRLDVIWLKCQPKSGGDSNSDA